MPVEAYRGYVHATYELFRMMWQSERIHPELVRRTFIMLHKKGSRDDMGNYRAICLLCHSYKLLSAVVARRLMALLEERLPDIPEAGFRPVQGCRDNVRTHGGYLPARVLHRRSRSYLRAIRSREPWHDSGHGCTHGPYGESLSTQMTLHSYTRTRSKPLHGSNRWLPAPYRIHKKTRTSATPEADVAKLNLS